MRIPRVFIEQPLATGIHLQLPDDQSHYISRVLRLPQGAEVHLFNGRDGEYRGHITNISKKRISVELLKDISKDLRSPLSIHLGIGLSRGERMDFVIQKATELGVRAITPLFTEHTEVKLSGERLIKKINHLRKISISACEQCGLNYPPEIHPPVRLDNWINDREEQLRLILHPADSGLSNPADQPASVALLIGPEGGFSQTEVNAALTAGFIQLQLGPRILRTETAPLAAISILQYRWGDLR